MNALLHLLNPALSCLKTLAFLTIQIFQQAYRGVVINTSKVHINNMYIKYTFVHFAILLVRQVSRVVPLPVIISFAVEALSFRLGSSFGLLHGSGNLLAILLEGPFISLALLLETSGLVNHQHLMLFLDF